MTRRRWILLGLVLALTAFCALGPTPRVTTPNWDTIAATIPQEAAQLDAYLRQQEAKTPGLWPDTEKRIVWHDGPRKTPLALVYLHGFSGTRQETAPLSEDIARALGANLFETRLRGHGQPKEYFGQATAEEWLSDTIEAFELARRLGDRVAIIGTSTGATLALWLAAQPQAKRDLAALVLLSPNLGPKDSAAQLLTLPWAQTLLPTLIPERSWTPANEGQAKYWTTSYPTPVLFHLQALVELVRALPAEQVTIPVFFLYNPDDEVIDAAEVERFFARIPEGKKQTFLVTPRPDEGNHVIAGRILSPSQTQPLGEKITAFLRPLLPQEAAPKN
jgi:esterase/lipase